MQVKSLLQDRWKRTNQERYGLKAIIVAIAFWAAMANGAAQTKGAEAIKKDAIKYVDSNKVRGLRNEIQVFGGVNLNYSNSFDRLYREYAQRTFIVQGSLNTSQRVGSAFGISYLRTVLIATWGEGFSYQFGAGITGSNSVLETVGLGSRLGNSGDKIYEVRATMRIEQYGLIFPLLLSWSAKSNGFYCSAGFVISDHFKQDVIVREVKKEYWNGVEQSSTTKTLSRPFRNGGFIFETYDEHVKAHFQLTIGTNKLFGNQKIGAFLRVQHGLGGQSFGTQGNAEDDEISGAKTLLFGSQNWQYPDEPYQYFKTGALMVGISYLW